MAVLKILIGRSPECDFVIENIEQNKTVSSSHATLSETESPDKFLFEDHSTNGSYINGQLLHYGSCEIGPNDHITLGRTYVLPLNDIVGRYFSGKETKTKDRPTEIFSKPPVAPPANERPSSPQPIPQPTPAPVPQPTPPPEVTIHDIPQSYWIMFVIAVILAFVLGFVI